MKRMADPDPSAQKRPHLDSAPLPSLLPERPPLTLAGSPPPSDFYSARSLPPPSPSSARPLPTYRGPRSQPSLSLPPSDIRALLDPRTIPLPGPRAHGTTDHAPVTDKASDCRLPCPSQLAPVQEPRLSPPSSTSNSVGPETLAPLMEQHSIPPNSWHAIPDHRPNGSTPNGYGQVVSPTHGSSGSLYHPPLPLPPPPPPPTPQNAQSGNLYAQSSYADQYGVQGQARRKQVRATQACNHCRSRKQKCDEARPCQFCKDNGFDCQYKDIPPPKQDRTLMQVQETVNGLTEVIKTFVSEISQWRLYVENRLPPLPGVGALHGHVSTEAASTAPTRGRSSSQWPTPAQGNNQHPRFSSATKTESPTVSHFDVSPTIPHTATSIKQELAPLAFHQPATPAESVRTDCSRASDSSPKDKSGLQEDHTTPAHKLLGQWQSMHTFYQGVDYLTKLVKGGRDVSDYALQLELDRGLIRIWGVGEGADSMDDTKSCGIPGGGITSNAPSLTQNESVWGSLASDSSGSSTACRDSLMADGAHVGGLGMDGRPDFRSHVLQNLLRSYHDNIHNLHPFLNPGELRGMIKRFSESYSPDMKPDLLHHPPHSGAKRKRSISHCGEQFASTSLVERSLRNALVLLVLALGKVCAYEEKLPAPLSDKDSPLSGIWDHTLKSPRSSFTSDDEAVRPRNIDLLPGMAYFSYAMDIIGSHHAGLTIQHAQAMILAALYLSQFARVLESWSWINSACRIVLVLIKKDYPKLTRKFNSEKKSNTLPWEERCRLNLLTRVYWTCLQLESDILAEMSTLTPSIISKHQNDIMYPEVVVEYDESSTGQLSDASGPETDTFMLAFSSQIWLRVILNEAHNHLYGATGRLNFDNSNIQDIVGHAGIHIDTLEGWRRVMPVQLAWGEDELPSTDLNIARIRAKYYGGRYMMLRPYLLKAIQNLELPPVSYSFHHESASRSGEHNSTPSRNVQMVDLSEEQRKIIQISCQCVESAIQSTIAFDRVGADPASPYSGYQSTRKKRLIVPNILGTLHAQFGNMLVLVAVYRSKIYRLICTDTSLNRTNLVALLTRTIAVLSEMSSNSPILRMDLEILHNLRIRYDLK